VKAKRSHPPSTGLSEIYFSRQLEKKQRRTRLAESQHPEGWNASKSWVLGGALSRRFWSSSQRRQKRGTKQRPSQRYAAEPKQQKPSSRLRPSPNARQTASSSRNENSQGVWPWLSLNGCAGKCDLEQFVFPPGQRGIDVRKYSIPIAVGYKYPMPRYRQSRILADAP